MNTSPSEPLILMEISSRLQQKLFPPIPHQCPPYKPPYSPWEMAYEWDTWNKSDTNIDSKHSEYLHRHRMTSGIEIYPEVWEECHTPSRYPDRQTLWSKYEESDRHKDSRTHKKPSIQVSWHTSLELRSSHIEEVAISKEMYDPPMKELEEADLSNESYRISHDIVIITHSIELDELRKDKSNDRNYDTDQDEEMWEWTTGIKWKHKKRSQE